jgi:hypothetical protein
MKQDKTVSGMIRDAAIMYDVENGLGYHCFMHACGYYEEQSILNNSTAPSHSVAHGFGGFLGPESAWVNWNGNLQFRAGESYDEVIKVYPEIGEMKTNEKNALFESAIHTQASNIYEIAEDGQTVRISMYTPGLIYSVLNPDKKKDGTWLWERYGIEYIYERGRWVEWHTVVCPDFGGPLDIVNWGHDGYERESRIRDGREERMKIITPAPPDVPGPIHRDYSIAFPHYDTVPWPTPYATWQDTDNYRPRTLPPLKEGSDV